MQLLLSLLLTLSRASQTKFLQTITLKKHVIHTPGEVNRSDENQRSQVGTRASEANLCEEEMFHVTKLSQICCTQCTN